MAEKRVSIPETSDPAREQPAEAPGRSQHQTAHEPAAGPETSDRRCEQPAEATGRSQHQTAHEPAASPETSDRRCEQPSEATGRSQHQTAEKILIAGCGYVGSALAELLVAEGHTVWGMRRHPVGLPAGVEPLAGDLCDPRSLADLPAGLDVVVYAVAADGFSQDAYDRAYLAGIENLIAALQRQGQAPSLLLYTSSTGVYAQTDGEWIDESSPADSHFFSGHAMLAGEQAALESPWPASVVRFGGIYGPGRMQFLDRVRRGEAPLPTELCYTNRVHRDDCAGILRHLIELSRTRTLAPVYLGVDDDPADRGEVIRWLVQTLGAPEPTFETDQDTGEHRPRGCKRCRNGLLRASGYAFRYPTYREGYASIIAATSLAGAGVASTERALHKRVEVPAPIDDVWRAWTTEAGLRSFFAPEASVGLRLGGPFELYFMPEAPLGARGSEGCRVLAFEAPRRLVVTWNFPPSLPSLRQQRTRVTVALEAVDATHTRVDVRHAEWRAGDDWDQGFAYFDRAWNLVLGRLRWRFEHGPVDWAAPYAVVEALDA